MDTGSDLRQLAQAYGALCVYRDKLITTLSPENGIMEELNTLISHLESELCGHQTIDRPRLWDWDDLPELNIVHGGLDIVPRPDFDIVVAKTTSLGSADDVLSPQKFPDYEHLLIGTMAEWNETRVRAMVDAFFLRVAAMLPTGKHIVIHAESNPPPTTIRTTGIPAQTHSGFMDYSVVVTDDKRISSELLQVYSLCELRSRLKTGVNGFFTLAGPFRDLLDCSPHAAVKLHDTAKYLEKKVIRGAITNGYKWMFLLLKMNDDSIGARYWESQIFNMGGSLRANIHYTTFYDPNVIAAILLHWTQNSFADLDENDLLVKET